MRLISWNTASRVSRFPGQMDFLAGRSPDLVALQEVTGTTREPLRDGLASIGLVHQLDTFDFGQDPSIRTGARCKGILVASRLEVERFSTALPIPWPERVLSCTVKVLPRPVELHAVHIPPGASHGWTKIEMFEGLNSGLACPSASPRILCGDFNSPQEERPDGTVVTWGQTIRKDGTVFVSRGYSRWDAAERGTLVGLAQHDLVDAFRSLHGYGVRAFSLLMTRKGREVRRRFDHVFASSALRVVECQYLQAPREAGLSDHAPIEVVLEDTAH